MMFSSSFATMYLLTIAALLGLVLGSFINCWAWRYLNGESVMRGRSHCTTCGHELGALDLVPVASWLASKGRCRYCHAKVSARYPISEAVCAAAFVAITARYGLSLETLELLAFACVLLFLSLTDIDEFIIPNGCIVIALAVRAAYMAASWATGAMTAGDIAFYVASAFGMGVALLAVVLVADRVFGRESMGGGDIKLFFVAGLYFGWQQVIFLVVVSCIIGIAVALASGSAKGGDGEGEPRSADASGEGPSPVKSKPFPFGPSIAAACVITMLVGDAVVSWYLALL